VEAEGVDKHKAANIGIAKIGADMQELCCGLIIKLFVQVLG
jgi:hypothetical protein